MGSSELNILALAGGGMVVLFCLILAAVIYLVLKRRKAARVKARRRRRKGPRSDGPAQRQEMATPTPTTQDWGITYIRRRSIPTSTRPNSASIPGPVATRRTTPTTPCHPVDRHSSRHQSPMPHVRSGPSA